MERIEERLRLGPKWRAEIARRGIDPDRLESAGWRSIESPAQGFEIGPPPNGWPNAARSLPRLAIPIWDREGRTVGLRARSLPGRTISMIGARSRLYGLDVYGADAGSTLHVTEGEFDAGSTLHVTEGEFDAESLKEVGAGAVIGLPGVAALHEAVERLAKAISPRRVATWFDGDSTGRRATRSLSNRLAKAGLRSAPMRFSKGADVNDLLRADRAGLIRALQSIEGRDAA